jgi:hypothetical protein
MPFEDERASRGHYPENEGENKVSKEGVPRTDRSGEMETNLSDTFPW